MTSDDVISIQKGLLSVVDNMAALEDNVIAPVTPAEAVLATAIQSTAFMLSEFIMGVSGL